MNNKEVSLKKQTVFSRSLTKISIEERVLFSKHLAMILRSGISTLEGLRLIKSQVKSKNFKRILQEAIGMVENGHTLSDALATNVRAFGELFINIINLGEMTGTLSENLNFLATELRKSKQLRSKVMGALVYPIILLFATGGIVGVLVFLIIPITTKISISVKPACLLRIYFKSKNSSSTFFTIITYINPNLESSFSQDVFRTHLAPPRILEPDHLYLLSPKAW